MRRVGVAVSDCPASGWDGTVRTFLCCWRDELLEFTKPPVKS